MKNWNYFFCVFQLRWTWSLVHTKSEREIQRRENSIGGAWKTGWKCTHLLLRVCNFSEGFALLLAPLEIVNNRSMEDGFSGSQRRLYNTFNSLINLLKTFHNLFTIKNYFLIPKFFFYLKIFLYLQKIRLDYCLKFLSFAKHIKSCENCADHWTISLKEEKWSKSLVRIKSN